MYYTKRRYYESLARRVRLLESVLLEGKRDQEILNNFLGDEYYSKFTAIKDKIKDPEYKDIYKMVKKDPDEVKDYIDNFQSKTDVRRAAKVEGATKLYEDDEWVVYKITSYPAAQFYGKNTRWCITGRYEGHEERGEEYFNKYINQNKLDGGYYFYINKKDPYKKFCILQQEGGKILSIWDAEDTNMGKKSVDLPMDLPEVEGVNLKRAKSKKDLLLRAINHDNGLAIEELLIGGVNPNTTYKGIPALRLAIDKECCNAVDALLAGGADANINNNGLSLIDFACRMANKEVSNKIVRSLLKYSSKIDDRTFNAVCQFCNYLTVKEMINLGYTPNNMSLWSAVDFFGPGKSRVVELLLQEGANPNVRNSYGETVLSKLLKMDSKNKDVLEAIKVLRDYGATE